MYEVYLFDGIFGEYSWFDSFMEAVLYIENTPHEVAHLTYQGEKAA